MSEIQSFVESIFDELVAIRRDIHAHPEVGMTEVRTSALIRSELEKMGVDEIQQPLPTAVVGLIHGTKGPGKCVALRADIDALLCQTAHYNTMRSHGLTGDLAYCQQIDSTAAVPVYSGGAIRLAADT